MTSVGICRSCRQPIDPAAKKCPHCHQLQGPARFLPWLPLVFLLAFVPYLWFSVSSIGRFDRQKEPFSAHRSEFAFADTSMNFNPDQRCPSVSVVGRVNNNGDIPWRGLQIEVRYFDQQGKLVDTATQTVYGTVPAHDEAAFTAKSDATLPKDSYAKFEVRVRDATDARTSY
jgi:hypothetical protein